LPIIGGNDVDGMTKPEMIKTDDLAFTYSTQDGEQRAALGGVNISVEKGEFIAILGRNGSGKSTLARHMNALLKPTGGSIWINGVDSKTPDSEWDIRRQTGMVFQNPDNQIIATIVEDDVAFGPENLGVPPEEIRRRVDGALKTVGMTEHAGQPPHNLSGGQKQRVAIAGVLAMKPDCIVLDEPTAMLDPSGRESVIGAVSRLNREGVTIILITHNMEEAVKAGRVVVMDGGRVAMDGEPRAVFSRTGELRKLGLDAPPAAECAAALRGMGLDLPEGILDIDELVDAICLLKSKT
jgi:energy-coupling factor transport system ATP-binding protein